MRCIEAQPFEVVTQAHLGHPQVRKSAAAVPGVGFEIRAVSTHGGRVLFRCWSFQKISRITTAHLAFQSIGVIYGDIGTSPLYVYASTHVLNKTDDAGNFIPALNDDILGVLSLIIYTFTLIPLIKYCFIVLQANDNGNG